MRFAYYTLEGSTISWAKRLVDEGHEVLVYCKSKAHSKVGNGIVPITLSRDAWLAWGMQNSETIYFVDCTDDGEFFERLRSTGKIVVGGGKFMDRLETDRDWGENFAKQANILCPPTKKFLTISAAIDFLKSNPKQEAGDGGWAWKPNRSLGTDCTLVSKDTNQMIEHVDHVRSRFGDKVSCIIQEKIDGVALSTARWWNGKAWTGPYEGTLEEKKFMDGDKGSATGCSLNTVWFYREPNPKIGQALQFDKLAKLFCANNAPPGLYDINAIVNKRGAWFLEWTPRLGIDSELTSQRGIINLSELLYKIGTGGKVDDLFDLDNAYHSVRLSVPPYPNEIKSLEKDSPALNVPVKGVDGMWNKFFVGVGVAWNKNGMYVADPYGFIGVCVSENRSVKLGFDEIYDYLNKLKIPNLQYRTDAAKIITKDLEDMAKNGWFSTPILRR